MLPNIPPVVILDRDGVINEDSPDYIKSPEEFIFIPGSLEAIAKLKANGHQVFLATNQSGIGRGLFSIETFFAINQKLNDALAKLGYTLDGIFFCPHTPDDGCDCRKPKPGMLEEIIQLTSVSAKDCVFFGDSKRDIEAGLATDMKVVLVKTGNGKKTIGKCAAVNLKPETISSLNDFVSAAS